MALIDGTYFKGDIALPYLEAGGVGVGRILTSAGESVLGDFIRKYEAEYLRGVLGRRLYGALLRGLAVPEPLPVWVDLKEALTCSTTGKDSPIAYYVYFFVSNWGQTRTSLKGEKKDKSTFAGEASNSGKAVMAWLHMQERTEDFLHWLREHWGDYRKYSGAMRPGDCVFLTHTANEFGI